MTTREWVKSYCGKSKINSGLCIVRTDIGKYATYDANGNPSQVTFGHHHTREALEAHVARWASSEHFKMGIVNISDVLDVEAA